jgi:SRSO17 transposase
MGLLHNTDPISFYHRTSQSSTEQAFGSVVTPSGQWYQQLFPEVRSYEAFKYLHVGMISEIKRKSLPEIGKFLGLKNEQSLLHFVYVKRQYIGNLGKVENGIVAVTAYGLIEGMTFPLIFEVYKPKERLKRGDTYRTKPEIAAILIQKLQAMGFKFKLVLADSLYGESDGNFVSVLNKLKLKFVPIFW